VDPGGRGNGKTVQLPPQQVDFLTPYGAATAQLPNLLGGLVVRALKRREQLLVDGE
jgi:hypothetical protein